MQKIRVQGNFSFVLPFDGGVVSVRKEGRKLIIEGDCTLVLTTNAGDITLTSTAELLEVGENKPPIKTVSSDVAVVLQAQAQLIKSLLVSERLTQKKMGEKLGVPQATISAWCNGMQRMKEKSVQQIKDTFELTPDQEGLLRCIFPEL